MSHNIIKINKTDTKVVRIVSEGPQGPTGARGAQGPTGSIFPHNASAIGYIENKGQAVLTGSLLITSSISGSGQSWLTGGGHITASGNITALGNITGLTGSFDYIALTGSIASDGNITANTASFQQLLLDGNVLINQDTNIISSGDYDLTIDPSDNIYIGNNNADNIYIGKNSGDNFVKIEAGGSNTVFISGSKVGLGNQYPQQTLSVTGDISSSGNLTVAGNITASGNISGSSTTTLTIGGLATFGTSTVVIDGTAGHITASGNISASGTIYANNFSSTGGNVDGISFTDELKLTGNLTSSGNISSSGNLTVGGNITSSGDISSSGTITAANLSVGGTGGSGLSITGDITASGHISTSLFSSGSFGHIYVGEISASHRPGSSSGIIRALDGKYTTITSSNAIIDTASFGKISSSILPDKVNLYDLGSNIKQWKDLYVGGIGYIDTLDSFSTTNITASGHVSITGDLTASVISASGNISTTGDLNIDGKSHFKGDITASGHVSASGNLILSGHITASGNISASGYISASGLEIAGSSISLLGGHITASGNISSSGNIINTGTFITTNITASGNISSSGGTIIASTITLGGGGTPGVLTTANIHSTGSITASIVSASSLIATTADINGGSIDGTSIGAVTPSTGVFSTLKSNGFLSASGNLVVQKSASIAGDLTVGGIVTANEIHVTVISSSVTHATGSNTFGDALNDEHFFTGSLIVSNSLNVIGSIITTGSIGLNGSLDVSSNITASGQISASGNIKGNAFVVGTATVLQGSGDVQLGSSGGTSTISLTTHGRQVLKVNDDDNVEITGSLVTTDNITTGGNLHLSASGGHITASGDISASGTITAANLNIGGTGGAGLSLTGDITASGNISASGIIYAEHLYSSDDAEITDNLIIGGHITSSGNISSSGGHITAKYYDASTVATGFRLGGSNILYFKTNNGGVAAYTFGRQNSPTLISGSSIELGRETTTHVTASGDISASGAMHMQTAKIYGTAIINSHITASGDISQSHTATSSLSQLTVHNNLYIKDGLLKLDNEGEGATYYENDKINFYYSPYFTIQEEGNAIIDFGSGSVNIYPSITSSGDISSSGTITAANLNIGGTGGTGLNVVGDITASGNISASGTIFANNFTSTGGNTSGITFDDDMNLTGDITASGYIHLSDGYGMNWGIENRTKIIGHEANDTITLTVDNSNTKNLRLSNYGVGINMLSLATSSLQVAGDIWASGSEGHITASGNISASGNLLVNTIKSDQLFIKNAAGTENIITGNSDSSVQLYYNNEEKFNTALGGVVVTGNITASGNISASGNLSITSDFNTEGNITASGNISSSGTVKALTGSFGVLTGLSPMTLTSPVTFTAPVTMSSHISASTGTVYAEHFYSSHDAEIKNHLIVKTISNVDTTHVTASGAISASGTLYSSEAHIIGHITASGDISGSGTGSFTGGGVFEGRVGIGTLTPTYKLDVESADETVASFVSTDNKAAIAISDNDTTGFVSAENNRISIGPSLGLHANNINIKTDTYNVGIGTATPPEKLTVEGNISASGHISASSIIASNHESSNALVTFKAINTNGSAEFGAQSSYARIYADSVLTYAANTAASYFYIGGANKATLNATGLGIGTASPSFPLDISGSVRIGGNESTATLYIESTGSFAQPAVASQIQMKGYEGRAVGTFYKDHDEPNKEWFVGVPYQNSNLTRFQIGYSAEVDGRAEYQASASITIRDDGDVGIGTTDPTEKLEVSGHVKITNSGNANLYINAHNADSDAGIFFEELDNAKAKIMHDASNNSLVFTDGALNDTMTISGSKVGIGTTSPSRTLDVNSGTDNVVAKFESTDGTAKIEFADDSTTGEVSIGAIGNDFHILANSGERVRVLAGGNVGIGTTTPTKALQVTGDISASGTAYLDNVIIEGAGSATLTLKDNTDDDDHKIYFKDESNNIVHEISTANDIFSAGSIESKALSLTTANVARLHIDTSGRVGIGTTSPGEKLEVVGNISASGTIIASQITASYFAGDGSGLTNVNTTAITGLMSNGVNNRLVTATGASSLDAEANLQFDDVASVLYLTGSMGIGTTTPSYDLDVHGDGINGIIRAYGSSIGRLSLQNSSRHYSLSVQNTNLYFYDETGGATRMLLDSNGNLGIGNNTPSEKLTVAGNISSSGNLITEGYLTTETHITASGNISSSGTIYASDMVFDVGNLKNATGDIDAASQSVPVGGIYRNGNILSIRIT
jgi:hypothetical protein